MRLIDADALKLSMMLIATGETKKYCYPCKEILKEIDDAPTIEERKTGKWINNIHDIPICDQCGYMTPYDRAIDDYEYGNYCPNCGADMREQP